MAHRGAWLVAPSSSCWGMASTFTSSAGSAHSGVPAVDLYSEAVERVLVSRLLPGKPPVRFISMLIWPAIYGVHGGAMPAWTVLGPAALHVVPELARWRDHLGEASGVTPRLAGSGSTWFVEGAHPGPDRRVVRTTGPATG